MLNFNYNDADSRSAETNFVAKFNYAVRQNHLEVVNELLEVPLVRAHLDNNASILLRYAMEYDARDVFIGLLKFENVIPHALKLFKTVSKNQRLYIFIALLDIYSIRPITSSLNRLLDIDTIIEMAAVHYNYALMMAACRGLRDITDRLLEIDAVRDNVAADQNFVLHYFMDPRFFDLAIRLLQIDAVRDDAAVRDNAALKGAARHGHLSIVNRLLEIDAVRENVATNDNEVLRLTAVKEHIDVATRLLQEPLVSKKITKEFIEQHKDFLKKIEDARIARILAAKKLAQAIQPLEVRNHILAKAYHDVLCGKAACLADSNHSEQFTTCPIIIQFSHKAAPQKRKESPVTIVPPIKLRRTAFLNEKELIALQIDSKVDDSDLDGGHQNKRPRHARAH